MAETKAAVSLVEVTLDRPYFTNGVALGYETKSVDGQSVTTFTGKAKVAPEIAEDLNRRQDVYRAYEKSLHANGGKEQNVEL